MQYMRILNLDKRADRKRFLMRMFEEDVKYGTSFEKVIAEQAIRYLNADVNPKKVENWASDITKRFRKCLT